MIPVLIPAYKPDYKLIELVDELEKLGCTAIVVVRDGGGSEYDPVFNALEKNPICHLVVHAVNLGKGRALKSGMNYILNNFGSSKGCVTADADGQHLPSDIMRIVSALENMPDSLILGVRLFGRDVPIKSRFGNILTKNIFYLLIGKKISDTQTGLRGIPLKYIARFMKLHGETYEYETQMLIATRDLNIKVHEIPITTLYFEQNRASHFNPIIDSMRIYFLFIRYSLSAISSFCLDYLLFILLLSGTANIAIASYVSRAVSMIFNYKMNARFVFASKTKSYTKFIKYLLLSAFSITVSYSIVSLMYNIYGYPPSVVKIIIEPVLFVVNFAVQREFIFVNNENEVGTCP